MNKRTTPANPTADASAARGTTQTSSGATISPNKSLFTLDALFANRPIEPVKVPAQYRLALVVVAIAMVLLPLIYIGIIGVAAYGIYFHVVNNTGILQESGGYVWRLILYVGPIIAGFILLFFMVKPLFARAQRRDDPAEVTPDLEPQLFHFVKRICGLVGAPEPRRIVVDCDANASASFSRGIRSFFGRDLTLTVGLPLVSGLTVREFGGVLAHEFGHFAQGAGMRFSYIIRFVSMWFARVVYERDEWDERLEEWSTRADVRLAAPLLLARLFVGLTRKILYGLMMVGNVISGIMLRQMEYDADRYEARIAGRDAFEHTSNKMRLIGLSSQSAYNDLANAWVDKRLADNFPELVSYKLSELPDEVKVAIAKSSEESKSAWTDTHPSDSERINSVSTEPADGVLRGDQSAEILFTDFESVSQAATLALYKIVVENDVAAQNLIPTADLIAAGKRSAAEGQAVPRYFGPLLWSPKLMGEFAKVIQHNDESVEDAQETLVDLRERIRPSILEYHHSRLAMDEASEKLLLAETALTLSAAELPYNAEQFGVSSREKEAIEDCIEVAVVEIDAVDAAHSELANDVRIRLAIAQSLLDSETFVQRYDETEGLSKVFEEQYSVVVTMSPLLATVRQLEMLQTITNVVYSRLHDITEVPDGLEPEMIQLDESMNERIIHLRKELDETYYPFDHADGAIRISDYLIPATPPIGDLAETYHAAQATAQRFLQLYYRLLSSVAYICELVEGQLGLPPLEIADSDAAENDAGPSATSGFPDVD